MQRGKTRTLGAGMAVCYHIRFPAHTSADYQVELFAEIAEIFGATVMPAADVFAVSGFRAAKAAPLLAHLKAEESAGRLKVTELPMTDEVILDDWNPTEATLRRWAFDENLFLSDQHEGDVLHREEYFPVLLELADDKSCPKAGYILSCLDLYLMFLVLRGSQDVHVPIVRKGAELAGNAKSAHVREWGQLQQRRLRYREGIGAVSREQALAMAQDLLNGICRQADISLIGERGDTWEIELSVPPTHRHKERLSISKSTGRFSFSGLIFGV